MTLDTLLTRLGTEEPVPLPAEDWDRLAPAFEVVARHDTFLRGDLLVVRIPGGLAAVESPLPAERVVRRLPDEASARRFVEERLDTYERMWNGCGCRIDYYQPTTWPVTPGTPS